MEERHYMHDMAKKYFDMGLNVIPVDFGEKKSAFLWKEFQSRRCTEAELKTWFKEQTYNIGIVCGQTSGGENGYYFASIDFDDPQYIQVIFPDVHTLKESTVVVQTARGIQVWVWSKKSVSTEKIPSIKMELKGETSYAMAPPSIHTSGMVYKHVGSLDKIMVVDDLEEFIKSKVEAKGVFTNLDTKNVYLDPSFGLKHHQESDMPECILNITQGVTTGMRNEAAWRYASYLSFFRKLPQEQVKTEMEKWNNVNSPPLDAKELKQTMNSGSIYVVHCTSMQKNGLCTPDMEARCPLAKRLISFKPEQTKIVEQEDAKKDIVTRVIASKIDRGLLQEEPHVYAIKLLKKAISFNVLARLHTETTEELTRDTSYGDQFYSASKVEHVVWVGYTYPQSKPMFLIDKYQLIHPGLTKAYYVRPMFKYVDDVNQYFKDMSKPEWTAITNVLKRFGIKNQEVKPYLVKFMVEVLPRFSNLEYLDDINWDKFITELLSFKAKKDSRLYTIYKATLLRGIQMRYVPHAIVCTNVEAGKSTFYRFAGMKLDAVTPQSLIGYARGKDEIYPGALNDQVHAVCLDQVESESSNEIIGQLLSFMEDGAMSWTKGGITMQITGKCPIVIAANPLGYIDNATNPANITSFRQILDVMTGNANAMGRRYGLLAYGTDYKKVELTDKSVDEMAWKELFEVFRSIEMVALPQLEEIFCNDRIRNWLESKLDEYTDKVAKHLAKLSGEADDPEVKSFLESHSTSAYRHIRGGALNCAIVDYLPQIVKGQWSVDKLLTLAEKYLKNILDINLESIANLSGALELEPLQEVAKMTFRHTYDKDIQNLILALQAYKRISSKCTVVMLEELKGYLEALGVSFNEHKKNLQVQRMTYLNITLKKYFGFFIRDSKEGLSLVIENWDKPGTDIT